MKTIPVNIHEVMKDVMSGLLPVGGAICYNGMLQPVRYIRPGVVECRIGDTKHTYRFCMDCKKLLPGSFMVTKEVWEEANLTQSGGIICLRCFSKRIARPLDRYDFTKFPVNDAIFDTLDCVRGGIR